MELLNHLPTDVIDYVEIATLGNALDFGDLTLSKKRMVDMHLHHQQEAFLAGGGTSSYYDGFNCNNCIKRRCNLILEI